MPSNHVVEVFLDEGEVGSSVPLRVPAHLHQLVYDHGTVSGGRKAVPAVHQSGNLKSDKSIFASVFDCVALFAIPATSFQATKTHTRSSDESRRNIDFETVATEAASFLLKLSATCVT